jgi:hypothetical protein
VARDWQQFHTARNLVLALVGEAGELAGGLVVRPAEATAQLNSIPMPTPTPSGGEPGPVPGGNDPQPGTGGTTPKPVPSKTRYYGQFNLDSVRAIKQLGEIMESVVEHLSKGGGNTTLTIEINSEAAGFDDRTQRVVKENAAQLGVKSQEFE